MDPNEALKNARGAAAVIINSLLSTTIVKGILGADLTDGRVIVERAEQLAEAFEALDGWLTGGGFLPDAWRGPITRVREQTTEEG